MKRFLVLIALLTVSVIAGCATTGTTPAPMGETSATPTTIQSAQDAAQSTILALGATLQGIPKIADTLYNQGTISKDTYNQKIVPVYNQAQASYKLLVAAYKDAVAAGSDPNQVKAYTDAMNAFLLDLNNVNNLVTALGGVK